ncbi:MAG: LuxR C-terminal-related transcriptional regulator [Burkholderiales bacterium]
MARPPGDCEPKSVPGSLLYRVHATTQRDAAWGDTLELLGDWLDGRWTTLASHRFSSGRGEVLYQAPRDPDLRAAYAEHAPRNPWFLSSAEYSPGRVLTGEELLSNRDLVKTDFYRSLLKPNRLLHRLCGVAARHGDLVYYVAVHRTEDQDGFQEHEKSGFQDVLSHLSLALENYWHRRQVTDFGETMTRIVERHGHATFLADAQGRILYKTKSAEDLLRHESGLRMDGERIAAAATADSKALREAMAWVANAPDSADTSRVVTVSVPGGRHPTVVSVYSAGRAFLAREGQSRELVVLTARSPHSEHSHHDCSFSRQFEFSPAQARVSAMIFTGMSLASTARALHVSENTVRSHLKQIFQKTNTHGQMELVHLHSRICTDKP